MHNQSLYLPYLAQGLKEYCVKWNYDWFEKLQPQPTVDKFLKIFCKITQTFFFKIEEDYYGARFNKKEETVKIYKCGKDCEKILAEEPVSKLLAVYVENNENLIE